MNAKLLSISLLAAGVLLATGSPANASGYKFTYLGTLPGGSSSEAFGINNSGQVVGNSGTSDGTSHATIWNGTTPTDLGTLGGGYSGATDINDSGQVVGYSDGHAVIWDGTTPTDLGTLGGVASGINNAGQVVGASTLGCAYEVPCDSGHATIWNGTTPTDLGFGGRWSQAYAINNSGQVVGFSEMTPDGPLHATIWNNGTPTDLGTLGDSINSRSWATGINDSGQVVGSSDLNPGYNFRATIWNGTTPTDLGTLGGGFSFAYAINNSGQVVGYSETPDGPFHATIWNNATPTDLNNFLSVSEVNAGWSLGFANAINDNGWIVGTAYNIGGFGGAYLLTPCDTCLSNNIFPVPVPEPETYAMFMAGLGLMGFIARRRKNDQA